ncbi:MAG: hypothetical protein ACYC3G_03345 [Minisyncoccota bacterium]
MDVFNLCALFLVKYIYLWVTLLVVYLVFIGQAIYYFFRLDRPEIKKEFNQYEIEATRRRIGRHLCFDLIVALIFFLLVVLSLGLKLWFLFFSPVISLIK